ncbi:MAG: hypothetical protein QM820_53310 [Minicystis sp.]
MHTRIFLLAGIFLVACGGAGSEGTGGAGGTSSSSSTGSTTTPGDGCDRGLVRCGDACVDIDASDAHCGACGNACGAGEVCVYRTCQANGIYCTDASGLGTACGGQCMLTSKNLDNCGACGNACDATSYCSEDGGGACKPWQGDGTSCASPIVLAETGNFSMEFWFPADTAKTTLSCGALDPRPSVSFRWTSPKTKSGYKFKVYGALTDDLVLEVFSAASCDPSTSLGCNDDETATKLTPELQMAVESGKTYFIVVGSKTATPPAGRFTLHIDD